MIQTQTIESVETAIQLGVLIPFDAKPKSRHRFWIGNYRFDAYLNPKRTLFIHWVRKADKQWHHPIEDGMVRGITQEGGGRYRYENGEWKKEFTPATLEPK